MQSIKKAGSLKNKYVLLRADLNVPLVNGRVRDDFRISKILPTLVYLQKKGAKTIVVSHLGDGDATLAPVVKYLSRKIEKVKFIPHILGEAVLSAKEKMSTGDILILENLRKDSGEKENNKEFAKTLSLLGEIYVNDAFSASHRKHASIVGVPKYLESFAGLQLEEEIKNLSKVLTPKNPFVFILGGAKISTKLPLISKYKNKADSLFVGGALANDFYKTLGYEVGNSLVDETVVPKNILTAKNIIIPKDIITDKKEVKLANKLNKGEIIYDAGPAFISEIKLKLANASTILINGPLGNYEKGFDKSTAFVLKEIAKNKKAKTYAGGGDSVAMIQKLHLEKEFTFVSTGGGAMLEFLSAGTLPGIEALR